MKAIEWVKKNLSSKLLGNKVNTPAAGEYLGGLVIVTTIKPDGKEGSLVLDGLGVIQLPEHWRN